MNLVSNIPKAATKSSTSRNNDVRNTVLTNWINKICRIWIFSARDPSTTINSPYSKFCYYLTMNRVFLYCTLVCSHYIIYIYLYTGTVIHNLIQTYDLTEIVRKAEKWHTLTIQNNCTICCCVLIYVNNEVRYFSLNFCGKKYFRYITY